MAIKHGCAPFGNGRARCNVWELPRPDSRPSRAAVHAAVRPGEKIPDLSGPQGLLAAAHPLRVDPVGQPQRQISADFHQRPAGRIRRRRRGDALQAWLAKLQPEMFAEVNPKDAADAEHHQRPVHLARGRRRGQDQGAGHDHPAGGPRARSGRRSISAAGSRARTSTTSTRKARRRTSGARRATPPPPTATIP